jgi:hypothetical protein
MDSRELQDLALYAISIIAVLVMVFWSAQP